MKQMLLGNFISIPSDNTSRYVATPSDLFVDKKEMESLATDLFPGWRPEQGCLIGYKPFDDPANGTGAERVVGALAVLREFFETTPMLDTAMTVRDNDGNPVKVARVHCIEMLDLIFKKTPEYGINTGNRRSVAMVVALAAQKVAGLEQVDLKIPAIIEDYEDELERRRANVRSNTGIDKSRKRPTLKDHLNAAYKILSVGGKESSLHKGGDSALMKRGTAQKCSGIIELNAKFPELEILDRCLDEGRKDHIDPSKLDKEKLRHLLKGSEKLGLPVGTMEDVQGYVADPKPDAKNEPKQMAKSSMAQAAKANENKVVQMVLFSVLHNQPDNLAWLAANAKPFNELLAELGGPAARVDSE